MGVESGLFCNDRLETWLFFAKPASVYSNGVSIIRLVIIRR